MVTMNRKDRQANVQVRVFIVYTLGVAVGEVHHGVRQILHLHGPIAKLVIAQDLQAFYLR
jgi:hypothetical protein